MALLKPPSKQPKTTTLQVRLEEEVRHSLDRYAEFIDATPSYVVSEALKLLFKKDDDFKRWLANIRPTSTSSKSEETFSPRPHNNHEASFNPIRCAREYSVLKTACPAPTSKSVAVDVRDSPEKFATSTANTSLGIPRRRAGRISRYQAAGRGHRGRKWR